jgi:hypothetical protein
VRRNVRDVTSYYASGNTVHPWGGSCSSQATTLWIGGSPSRTCEVAPDRERFDSVITRRSLRGTVRGTPGTRITQVFTFRNRGSATWTGGNVVLRHRSGAFRGAAEAVIPAGVSVRPGQRIRLRVTVTVPSTPGTYRGEWRLARVGGSGFGAVGSLTVRVPRQPRDCSSWTLGRNVDSGTCVQVSYAGCGRSRCSWWRCSDGGWSCTDLADCRSLELEHPWCANDRPPVDGCTDDLLDNLVSFGNQGFDACSTAGQYRRCTCTRSGWSSCGACMRPR